MRPTGVRRLALVLLLAACASGTPAGPRADPATADLTVQQAFSPGRNGMLFIEGAQAELLLERDGAAVDTEAAGPEQTVVFRGLPLGSYRLAPALRPCDANCGRLDGRVGECALDLVLDGDRTVTVRYVVGETCSVSPVG